jgi:N-acyl-L-homoserine lactone synthetase
MIEVMTLESADRFPGCLESMHRLRHHVFIERLGWDIPSVGGLERDQLVSSLATIGSGNQPARD